MICKHKRVPFNHYPEIIEHCANSICTLREWHCIFLVSPETRWFLADSVSIVFTVLRVEGLAYWWRKSSRSCPRVAFRQPHLHFASLPHCPRKKEEQCSISKLLRWWQARFETANATACDSQEDAKATWTEWTDFSFDDELLACSSYEHAVNWAKK